MSFAEYFNKNELTLNEEQLSAVMSTANTVVSAGAGSGKTTVLSYRFLRLVMDGLAHSDEILTLTFTRKAALEMSERIYKRLSSASSDLAPGEMDRFAKSSICTLDSFCSEIVRAGCVSYGISRDFQVDESDSLRERVSRLSSAFIQDEDNSDIVRLLSTLYTPDALIDDFFMAIAYNVVLPCSYSAAESNAFFLKELKRRSDVAEDKVRECLLHLEGYLSGDAEKDRISYLEAMEKGEYFRMGSFNMRKRSNFQEEAKEIIPDYREALGVFIPLAALLADTSSSSLLQQGVEKFASMLKKDKRMSGLLSFADTAALAVDILKNNRDIREYYKSRFRFIMIDEFQDNNSLQRDLLYLLSAKPDFNENRVPEASELVDDRLFFVGDEKQSIYRFRGADVSVFRALDDEIRSIGGSSLSLTRNYRSDRNLISFFNRLFMRVLVSEGALYEARFEETLPGESASAEGRVLISLFDRDEIVENGLTASENEAEYIGNLILRMLSSDEFLVRGKRPTPSDIAILMRTGSGQLDIERALKNRDIPYQLTETHSLMLDAVSSDFYSLLEMLVYSDDLIAREAVLRGPFARISDMGIIEIMAGKAPSDSVDAEKYSLFSAFFEKLQSLAFRVSLAKLVEYCWVNGGYASYILDSPAYSAYSEHYEYLFSYAVSYDESGLSLTDYVKFLRDNMASGGKLDETVVLHSRKEGVQIMTIHKSKGLEFPIVISAGMGNGSRGNEGKYIFNYSGHLIASSDKDVLKILQMDDSDREMAELRRLLYVAATRAENHLVFTGSYKLSSSGDFNKRFTGPLLRLLLEGVGYDCESGTTELEGVDIESIPAGEDYFHGSLPSADTNKLRDTYNSFRVDEFAHHSRRVSVTSIENDIPEGEVGMRLSAISADDIIASLSAQDSFGTLCHAILEARVNGGKADDIPCLIANSEEDNRRILEDAAALADGFFSSPLYKQLEKHDMRSEVRFYTYLDGQDAALEGVMDLIVFLDDYNIVVDYKSDSSLYESGHLVQLTTYIRAAEELYKKPCYGTLYYLRSSDGCVRFIDRDGNAIEL